MRPRARISSNSVQLAVIATDRDCVEDWLLAGLALARILVTATAAGLTIGYLNQPIGVPGLRLRLVEMMSSQAHPQLILRLGYGPKIPPSSRRRIDDVIMGETVFAHF